jgi:hypothetical protein
MLTHAAHARTHARLSPSILFSNPLSGVVPTSFLKMTKLTTMHVQRTQLKGIPEQLMAQTGHASLSRTRRVDIGKARLGLGNATNATALTKAAAESSGGTAAPRRAAVLAAGERKAAVSAASRVLQPRDAVAKPNGAAASVGRGAAAPDEAAGGGDMPRRGGLL